MKISQREKYLLMVVGCVLVVVLYYQFVLTPQKEKVATLEGQLMEVQARYDQVMSNIATLPQRQEKIKGLTASISERTSAYYPTLIQEKIILELDEIIEKTGIKATFSFSTISAQTVQGLTAGEYVKPQSSLEPLVDEIKGLQSGNQQDSSTEADQDASNESNVGTSSASAEVLTVSMTFNGSYEVVKTFIDTIQNWKYNLVITNLSLSPQSETEVAGSFNLEFYGVPKLQNQDQAYLDWTLNNTYGKEMPFSTGVANGAYNTMIEELLSSGVKIYDFMMVVRSSVSDLPAVTIGKALDESRESYLFADQNEIEPVVITLSQKEGVYYYRYETSEGSYPTTTDVIEFIPSNGTIDFQIISEPRQAASDLSGVSLKVINHTDLVVNIEVQDDDSINPRISVLSEGFTVNVTKK
ncbi:hypothetical protein GMA43_05485 [Turicibacter sanguinis]|uniref:type II secretion system protein GspM n=1 Tax=Turicibacter sanguinis TaxID=154288 RepID=UPI0011CB6832|nr:type II secretion system protein GspM [Turicibacter sanguinis]MCU7195390.1 type II secretion system protein GspM [Turicibacter sanguinis]MDB8458351.1 type II secretion system protein GspM [Turicibacter sanguinis]MDB8563874.1 type II secretion system protein GspM [Turicibacter sanguinis]MTH07445.1 hypothetical protein [Turicibacter sanguinis]MTH10178.1 hypothetical protein [Turicibacter sanguinis]